MNTETKKSRKVEMSRITNKFTTASNKKLINDLSGNVFDPKRRAVKKKKDADGKLVTVKPYYIALDIKTGKTIVATTTKGLQKKLKTDKDIDKTIINRKSIDGKLLLFFKNKKERAKFFDNYVVDDTKYKKIINKKSFLEKTQDKLNADRQHRTIKYALNFSALDDTKQDINTLFSAGISNIISQYKDTDKIRLIISGGMSGGASLPYLYIKDFKDTYFNNNYLDLDFTEVISTSEGDFEITSDTTLTIAIQKNPFSAGRGKIVNNKRDMLSKRSILKINNDDDLCLGRCIVCEFADLNNHPQKKQIRMGRKIQTELTHELYESNGIEKCLPTLETIKDFEEKLDICITIIDGDQFNNVVYPDVNDKDYKPKEINVYLYKTQNHFDLITSSKIKGFFGVNNYCNKCKKAIGDINNHKCKFKCNICCSYDCDSSSFNFKENSCNFNCKDCLRWFPTNKCIDNHKNCKDNKGLSTCDKIWKCGDCKKIMNKKDYPMKTHKCGDYKCNNCGELVGKDHKCYMMPKPVKPYDNKYIYFDFECDIVTDEKHIPNFCVAQYHKNPENFTFDTCDEFCNWIFQEKHNHYTFIAHNGRGYDFQLIMEWIYKNTSYKPFTIYAGSKIMTFSVSGEYKIRFLDSLNFLTMRLEDFPGTFGLNELKKGFYPYWFNSTENWNYLGKMPDKKYYKPNKMLPEKRDEFNKWYDELKKNDFVYSHSEETKNYCISDVDILRRSCEVFRDLYIEIAQIDPFCYTTIASVCMAIFKANYIVTDYQDKYNELQDSLIDILNNDEYDDLDKKILIDSYKQEFNDSIREIVFEEKKLAIFNYKETEFMRKSFFGGRTNATKLKYTFKGNEEGKYADITSLYPSVNYYDDYPLGHPEKILEDFDYTLESYFGFVDCDVICPKDLYFPVLANKGKKLMFDLKDKRGVWATNELKKALEMGYKIKKIYEVYNFENTSNNLFKGYISKFLKIKQEASGLPDWVTKPDKDNCIEDYKLDYILSLTQDERTDLYIELYNENQGILMDKSKIVKNKGLRAIAKLCLNSLWGKFGQRVNMPQTEIIGSENNKKYWDIMFNDKYCNQNIYEIDEKRVEMSFKLKDEYIKNDFNTNIAVASFTTSSARLRLYEGLEVLDKQVLYHDTDSIVYIYDPDDPDSKKMPLGDYLGDWTDELEGCKMVGTFISGGPKNYSYETDDGEYHTKIKGFTLNYDAIQLLNHNNMIDMVTEFAGVIGPVNKDKLHLTAEYNMINRNKDKTLTNYEQTKNYGFCYDKREIQKPDEYGNIDTRPWGFTQN